MLFLRLFSIPFFANFGLEHFDAKYHIFKDAQSFEKKEKQIAPKEHLRPTGMMFVRTYVRTSRWKILFSPYLVVELSPSAEIRCGYVTSINDGTQILTFLGIHNYRDFQNSLFFCGSLIILTPELH